MEQIRPTPLFMGLVVGALSLQVACIDLSDQDESEQELFGPKLSGELWSTSQKDGKEFIINKQGQLVKTIDLPGAGPHITTFPESNKFAYVGGMLDGKLYVLDANSKQVVTSIQVGPTLAHQAKPSPDGKTLLVSVIASQSVVKIAADEHNRTWSIVSSASTSQFGKPPICTIYRNDGKRAYVSLNPSGLAVLDVQTMTFINEIPTDGFIACGMIKQTALLPPQGQGRATIASSGSGGHIYNLDMNNDTLTDRGTLGAASWHTFIMTADGLTGFGTSPLSDEVIRIGLALPTAQNLGSITFNSQPGTSDDQPDALGGGETISGLSFAVSLRAAGNVAFVDTLTGTVQSYLHLSTPGPFNPATCQDCAVHGITIRK